MKKSKVAVLAMVLLLPMAGCTSEETSSTSQPPADLVLNENQGVRMIKEVDNGYREPSTYSIYFDINFRLSHQVDNKTVWDFPIKFTTIKIEQPYEFSIRNYDEHVNWTPGTLYDGILKINFEFPDYIYDYCGYEKDNGGNWIPGPAELLTTCYPNDDGTYINNPSLYHDIAVSTGGMVGENSSYTSFFFEVYDL